MRMFTEDKVENTFIIDKSNGYPVIVTTNVTKNTPWLNILTKHGIELANPNGTPGDKMIDGKKHHWVSSEFFENGPGGVYPKDDYINVFIDLKYNGNINDCDIYRTSLEKFAARYNNDEDFRTLLEQYVSLKEKKWNHSFKKFRWSDLSTYFTCESNDLEKRFNSLEDELIEVFNTL